MGSDLWGVYYRFFVSDFCGNFDLDSMKNLLEVLRFFLLLNLGGKNFKKKSSDWLSRDLKSAVVNSPINQITIVKMSKYISLRLIFANFGTFIHFVVNSNQEKIWGDSDIFVRVMTSSIFKCGSGPPHKSISS